MTQIVIDRTVNHNWIDGEGKYRHYHYVNVEFYDLSLSVDRSLLFRDLRGFIFQPPVCYEMFLLGDNSRVDVTIERVFKILHRIWRDGNDI